MKRISARIYLKYPELSGVLLPFLAIQLIPLLLNMCLQYNNSNTWHCLSRYQKQTQKQAGIFLVQIPGQFCDQSEAWQKFRISRSHMMELETNFNFLSSGGCVLTQLSLFHRVLKTKLPLHHGCEHTQQIWESCHNVWAAWILCHNPYTSRSHYSMTALGHINALNILNDTLCFKYAFSNVRVRFISIKW